MLPSIMVSYCIYHLRNGAGILSRISIYRLSVPVTHLWVGISTARWDAGFAALVSRLPLAPSTMAYLKRDLILALRHPRVFVQGIIMTGLALAVSVGDPLGAGPLVILYFIPIEFASAYLGATLSPEGSNLDYMKMLLEKGKFLAIK